MLQDLRAVSADEIKSAANGAEPFTVTSINGDGMDGDSGEEIVRIVCAIVARHFGLKNLERGVKPFVGVFNDEDSIGTTNPELSIFVKTEILDLSEGDRRVVFVGGTGAEDFVVVGLIVYRAAVVKTIQTGRATGLKLHGRPNASLAIRFNDGVGDAA